MATPDTAVLDFVVAHRLEWVTWMANAAAHVGTSLRVTTVDSLAVLAWMLAARRWRLAITICSAVLLAGALSAFLKPVIARPRPPAMMALVHAAGYSMPSTVGAITAAAGIATVLAARPIPGLLVAAVLVVVVLIGVCMIYVGAHWTTDVLAGWFLGGLTACGCWIAVRPPALSAVR